jgi:phage-related protein
MNVFELWGSLGLKDQGFSEGLAKAEKSGEGFGSKMGNAFATIGKASAVGLGAAATAFAGLATKAITAGGELEQNIGGSEAVFKQFAETIQTTGTKAFATMGLSQSDFLATANKMGALMQGSGLSIEQSMTLSSAAMQRAADVASIMGLDTSAAMESVAGAAKGNFTMMDNLGVAMNATTIEAYALSKGIQTSYNDMDNAQKVGLAMQMFLEKTAYAAGNYAKENETLAGSISTASAAINNFLSGAGDASAVIDSVVNVADVVGAKVIELLPRLTEGLSGIVTGLMPQIPPLLQTLLPAIVQGATGLFDAALQAMPALSQAFVDVIPMISSAILTMAPQLMTAGIQIVTNLIQGVAGALPDLIPQAVAAIMFMAIAIAENAPLLLNAGLALVQGIADGVSYALPNIFDLMPDLINGILSFITGAIPTVLQAGTELFATLAEGLPFVLTIITENMPQLIDGIVSGISSGLSQVVDVGKQLFAGLAEGLPEAIAQIASALPTLIDGITQGIATLFPMVVSAGVELFSALVQDISAIISAIVEALPQLIQAIVNSLNTFIPMIVTAGVQLLSALAQNLPAIIAAIVQALPQIITAVINGLVAMAPALATAGVDLFVALIQNLPAIIVAIVAAIPQIIIAIMTALAEAAPKVAETGLKIFASLIQRLPEALGAIVTGIQTINTGILNAFQALPGQMATVGLQIIQGLKQGILNAGSEVVNAAKNVAQNAIDGVKGFLGIHSPSEKFAREIGIQIPAGMGKGVSDNAKVAINAAKNMSSETFSKAKAWIEQYRQEADYNVAEEGKMWSMMTSYADKGSKQRIEIDKNVNATRQKAQKETFQSYQEEFDHLTFYGEMTAANAVKFWEEAATSFAKGSDELINAQKKAYTAAQELAKETFDISKTWIDLRVKYGQASGQDEVDFWAGMTQKYREGTDLRKQADQELMDAQQRLFDEQEKLTAQMTSAEQKYQDALASRTQAYANVFGIFDEYRKAEDNRAKDAADAEQKLRDVEEKIRQAKAETADDIAAQQTKLADLDKQLTDAQLKYASARELASKSEGQLLTENLQGQVDEMQKWADNMALLSSKGLDEGFIAELQKTNAKSADELAGLAQMTDAELNNYVDLWRQKQKLAREAAIEELKPLRAETDAEITNLTAMLNEKAGTDFFYAGENTMTSFIYGIKNKFGDLIKAMYDMGDTAIKAAEDALQIHSPSKFFLDMGENVGNTFIKGVDAISNAVYDSVDNAFGNFGNYEMPQAVANENAQPAGDTYYFTVDFSQMDDLPKMRKLLSNLKYNKNVAVGVG